MDNQNKKIDSIFVKIIQNENTWFNNSESEKLIRFIFSTGIFILFSKCKHFTETCSLNNSSFPIDILIPFINMQIVKEFLFSEILKKKISLNDMILIYHYITKGVFKE